MENKINIAEILRNMPKGTKLYSPLFSDTVLECVDSDDKYPITVTLSNGYSEKFSPHGIYFAEFEDAEPVLYPSSKMRCWDKFFKRGDVVFNEPSGLVAIFDGWVDDDYTEFNTTINRIKNGDFWGEEEVCETEFFAKVTDEERAEFIAAAEKYYGGKYNPETLQVEPVKPVKPVKVVEPKCPFKPFDKVLVRDYKDEVWKADYFSHYEWDDKIAPYVCVGSYFRQCIHYEGSEHLLGTDKSPK